jgi:hypothetical protein
VEPSFESQVMPPPMVGSSLVSWQNGTLLLVGGTYSLALPTPSTSNVYTFNLGKQKKYFPLNFKNKLANLAWSILPVSNGPKMGAWTSTAMFSPKQIPMMAVVGGLIIEDVNSPPVAGNFSVPRTNFLPSHILELFSHSFDEVSRRNNFPGRNLHTLSYGYL